MPVITLTPTFLNSGLHCPKGVKRIEYCDADVPGLLIEVRAAAGSIPTWYVRYKEDKKTRYSRLGDLHALSLTQARKMTQAFKANRALQANTPTVEESPPAELTLDVFVREHVNPYNKMRKRSHWRDLQLYNRIGPRFGGKKLTEINRREVQVFHNELVSVDGLSPATADHHIVYFRRILNLALQWEFLEKNVLTKVPLMKVDNKVERYLSDDETARLVAVLQGDPAYGASNMLLFLLSTGARLSEAMFAKWDQIDEAGGSWRIPASNSKSKKARVVPLNDSARWVIERLETKGRHEYLFVNSRTDKPFVTITRAWYRLRAKAGIENLRVHDLRHSFASFLVNAGRSLFEVQHLLGHGDPRVSQRYAHLSQRTLQEASNAASMIVRTTESATAR